MPEDDDILVELQLEYKGGYTMRDEHRASMILGKPSDLHPVLSPGQQQPDNMMLEGTTVDVSPSTKVQRLQDAATPLANLSVEALSSRSHTEEDSPSAPRGTPRELSQDSKESHGYTAEALLGDGVPAAIDAAIARSSPGQAARLEPITPAQSGLPMDIV